MPLIAFFKKAKLFATLLLIFFLQRPSSAYSEGITLTVSNASLDSVFQQIQQQTNYKFVYTNEQLTGTHLLSFSVKGATLDKVLEICFTDQPLSYSIEDKFIIVKRKNLIHINNNTSVSPAIIFGRVTNDNNEPLAGATIVIKGSNRVVQTDANGEFTISNITEKTVLVVSNVGFETIEIKPEKNTHILIRLHIAVSKLDEVKIMAYGTTTERLSTGNISKISSEEIEKQATSNPLEAMEGRVPGLLITQGSGVPGGAFNVALRGQNSLANGNDPLYIIDGVPFTSTSLSSIYLNNIIPSSNPLNNINPSDIQEIEILKDADATAIYGSRGANGVILITTKKGKSGKTKLDLSAFTGFGSLAHKMKLLNTSEYLQMRHEAFKNDSATVGFTDYDLTAWDTTKNTDWQKTLLGGRSSITDAKATISGGNAFTQFLTAGEYYRETTVFPGKFADQKGSARLNINHQSADGKLMINISASYLVNTNNLPATDITYQALTLAPDAPPVFDSAGKLNWANSTWPNANPLSFLKQVYKAKTDNLMSNLLLSYQLMPGLYARISAGYTSIEMNEISTIPVSSIDPAFGLMTGFARFADNSIHTWIAEPQIEFKKNIGKGKLGILIGTTFQQNAQAGKSLFASGFVNDALLENIGAASAVNVINSTVTDYKYNAFFGRISYDLKDRYLFNITARRDGSSRFGPDKQFANFGALGAGWIFSKEQLFEKAFPGLSFGKIRFSYGTTGNDQIGDYQFLNSYTPTSYPYQGVSGLFPSRLFNPDYSWEINKKFESGLELGFFKDRILFSADYYLNRSSSQLVGYALAPTTGFSSIQSNLDATVQNTGMEFVINTSNIKTTGFTWKTSFNITIPRNKLVSYPGLQNSSYATTYVIGKPLSVVQAFHYTGVDPATGIYTFEDVNKDGQLTYPEDLTSLKQVSQNYYGGLENIFEYQGFQLSVFFQFIKQTGRDYIFSGFGAPGFLGNQPEVVMDRWQQPGDKTNIQRFTQSYSSPAYSAYANSLYYGDNTITDASFIKLKNVSLSYHLSTGILQRLHVQDLKIFLRGQNLFTITHYIGLNPQNQSAGFLPPLREITAGIQLIL